MNADPAILARLPLCKVALRRSWDHGSPCRASLHQASSKLDVALMSAPCLIANSVPQLT